MKLGVGSRHMPPLRTMHSDAERACAIVVTLTFFVWSRICLRDHRDRAMGGGRVQGRAADKGGMI